VKVVFIEDVPDVAEVGDVKNVADGYGRNFLLPQKLAVLANSQASHLVESRLKAKAKREAQTRAEMEELAKQMRGKEITVKARVGAKEKLYGSITSADIVEELAKIAGREIDKRKVELPEPLRHVGVHEVDVKLFKDVTVSIKINVVPEEAEKEEEKEEKKAGKKKTKAEEEAAETVEVSPEAPETEEAPAPKKTKKSAKKKVTVAAEADTPPGETGATEEPAHAEAKAKEEEE